ncbi:hypothetical protein [Roseovarius marisflavi]|uniref:hypothetical protein n=1 Tax=Roseovarius marisflavi TaxID=1054996 RepID=UPI0014818A2B|nr:hypothetical protein [Roseovarius marisflavi]
MEKITTYAQSKAFEKYPPISHINSNIFGKGSHFPQRKPAAPLDLSAKYQEIKPFTAR